nr:immunoglobulin light chain junction region [Macaca mulatta]
CQRYIGAPFTF